MKYFPQVEHWIFSELQTEKKRSPWEFQIDGDIFPVFFFFCADKPFFCTLHYIHIIIIYLLENVRKAHTNNQNEHFLENFS